MELPGSGHSDIARYLDKSNVGQSGVFVYRVDGEDIEDHCYGEWLSESLTFRRSIPKKAQAHGSVRLGHRTC